jgi:beta-aspartyl-peptidase (threonine type)
MVKPFIIGTSKSRHFLIGGVKVLRRGGSALDAVEEATRLVELNPDDTSVGLGGIPNLLGFQEMDASIMCGKTLDAGAVGAIKGFKHPISVARKVLDEAPHVLLVGSGAERFARVMGCETGNLETEMSRKVYDSFIRDVFEHDDIDESQRWAVNYAKSQDLREWYTRLVDEYQGTVNIIAMDDQGNIASAVSTSGTALKFPGRLGDSPIIGAGNYSDNRYGAAACTGRGELAIRNSTARTVIYYIANGLTVREAAFRAMKDIHELKSYGNMNCIAIDHKGNTVSATIDPEKESIHWYMDIDSIEPEKRIGINVPR